MTWLLQPLLFTRFISENPHLILDISPWPGIVPVGRNAFVFTRSAYYSSDRHILSIKLEHLDKRLLSRANDAPIATVNYKPLHSVIPTEIVHGFRHGVYIDGWCSRWEPATWPQNKASIGPPSFLDGLLTGVDRFPAQPATLDHVAGRTRGCPRGHPSGRPASRECSPSAE